MKKLFRPDERLAPSTCSDSRTNVDEELMRAKATALRQANFSTPSRRLIAVRGDPVPMRTSRAACKC